MRIFLFAKLQKTLKIIIIFRIKFPCPYNFNPADHYIHILAITPGDEENSRENVEKICNIYDSSDFGQKVLQEIKYQFEHVTKETSRTLSLVEEKPSSSPYKASWWSQFKALLWRSFLSVIKEPMIMQVRLFQTIVCIFYVQYVLNL